MKKSRILVVDDEKMVVKGLKFSLEQEGMEVDTAGTGEEALNKLQHLGEDEEAEEYDLDIPRPYDLVLLDLGLPDMDGLEVCLNIRSFSEIPIIIISAKGEDMDKIMGLEYGADDYVTKPFNILEVKARIKAVLKRCAKPEKEESAKVLECGDIKLELDGRRLYVCGQEVNLTAKEFDMLELMASSPDKVFNRETLLNTVWGYEYPGDVRTVDVHIRRLREKMEPNPADPRYIHTKWGVGYYFKG